MSDVKVPKFGMSTVEVDVMTIFVSVGQQVQVGDPLIEVETDKVTAVVEAETAGTITEIVAEVGTTYEVGDVLCRIE